MKAKAIISFVLVLLMLFSANCISAIAQSDEPENTVILFADFTEADGALMESRDNNSFSLTVNLEKGVYRFLIAENDIIYGHPTTINDTTDRFSSKGIIMSSDFSINCTLLCSGGKYTFIYNCESDCLRIAKDGFALTKGETLKIHTGDNVVEANLGDKIKYNVYLKTNEVFEDVQTALNFDKDKLALSNTTTQSPDTNDNNTDALANCPNLKDVFFNSTHENLVSVNASSVEGYDFTTEKLFLTLEFTVVDNGETYLDFNVQDMTAMGGAISYYYLSQKKTDGADFRIETQVIKNEKPTDPVKPTDATEPAEPSVPSEPDDNTEPSTGIVPTSTADTTPSEIITFPTTMPVSTDSTDSTEPSNPVSEFELGDVTRDKKLNIKDVTAIQKHLAMILDFDEEQKLLADYLQDTKINIKDATQIQKKLANII